MNERQIEDLFSFYGYSDLYNRFKTPIYVTGLLDNIETETLEDFFDTFSFEDHRPLFDEFRYWFRYFLVTNKSLNPYEESCFIPFR